MKKLLILLLFSPLFAIAQKPVLINTLTSKHTLIPGTHIYIVPPTGYSLVPYSSTLKNDNGSAITIMDLNGGNFYSNSATFNRESFEKMGAKVADYREFTINDYQAKFTHLIADNETINLVIGDSTFSVMLMGVISKDDEAEAVKKSLLSVVYDKKITVNPLDAANFILDDSKSDFKFWKSSASVFMYALDGKEPQGDAPLVLLTSLPSGFDYTIKELQDQLLNSYLKNGFTDLEEITKSETPLNGSKALKARYKAKLRGAAVEMNLIIFTVDKKAVYINALFKTDIKYNSEQLDKLISTFKFK